MLCKPNGYHIPSSVMWLSFSGKMKGLLCWWKGLLWWDFVWRGVCMKSFFALSPGFLVAMGLSFCMSHLEGDPWGSDRSIFGRWLGAIILHESHLYLLSLWNCMGLQLLTLQSGMHALEMCSCYIRYSGSLKQPICHNTAEWNCCVFLQSIEERKIISFNIIS